MKILCLAGSLRNTLRGGEVSEMVETLKQIKDKDQLLMLLSAQGQSGPELDDNASGKKFSNSETLLCLAAWAA
ncbi:MAG: hypothetical protein ABIK45_14185, partial [Pseudomonadota bacterium]